MVRVEEDKVPMAGHHRRPPLGKRLRSRLLNKNGNRQLMPGLQHLHLKAAKGDRAHADEGLKPAMPGLLPPAAILPEAADRPIGLLPEAAGIAMQDRILASVDLKEAARLRMRGHLLPAVTAIQEELEQE